MTDHDCCYWKCPEPASIFIGKNSNANADWICAHHYDKWHADRVRFLADGLGCAMQEL